MSFDNQRLFDLVRQQRMELFTADLITHDEYAELATEHSAVRRLEDYDVIRQQLATERAAHAEELRRKEGLLLRIKQMEQDDRRSQVLCYELAGKLGVLSGAHDKLADELRRVEQERQWQPIATAPRDGTKILLAWTGIVNMGRGDHIGFYAINSARSFDPETPTHWMTAPEPPSEQAKG